MQDKNIYVPAAILVGAIIIAGAIIYAVNPRSGGEEKKETAAEFYRKVAKGIGVDLKQFDSCVSEEKYKDKVAADYTLGIDLEVGGTPSTFVNGVGLEGGAGARLEDAIDKALAGTLGEGADISVGPQDHVQGNREALVTIVEFSDLQCPFCRSFHPLVQEALAKYGDKVRWVYKHFPLTNIHPQAVPAALASECIAEQKGDEGFWKFIDEVFKNQEKLNASS